MKTVVWIGPDRLIPPWGATEKGRVLELPDNIADSFVKQKLAKLKGKQSEAEKEDK